MATTENAARPVRAFAIVPAAGQSRRMGRPKLMLPCPEGTLIERVLAAWCGSSVERIVVVARRDDATLLDRCRSFAATLRREEPSPKVQLPDATLTNEQLDSLPPERVSLVLPSIDPPDMKDSVAHAICFLRDACQPAPHDVWLLAPADMPDLAPDVVNALVKAHDPRCAAILVPVFASQRGHPVLFPWCWADDVLTLSADEGVNALLRRHPTREVTVQAPGTSFDIDTPADYDQWRKRHSSLSEHPDGS